MSGRNFPGFCLSPAILMKKYEKSGFYMLEEIYILIKNKRIADIPFEFQNM